MKFYKNRMKTFDKQIEDLKHQVETLTASNKEKGNEILKLELSMRKIRDAKPIMKTQGTQLSVLI